MLKKIIDLGLKLSCSAVGAFILFMVSVAAGTMSSFGSYEHEMPDKLIPKENK